MFTLVRRSHNLQSVTCLSSLITEFKLSDVWRVKHTKVRQYTWVKDSDGKVSVARLAMLYVSDHYSGRIMQCAITPMGFTDQHFGTLRH